MIQSLTALEWSFKHSTGLDWSFKYVTGMVWSFIQITGLVLQSSLIGASLEVGELLLGRGCLVGSRLPDLQQS